MKSLSPNAEEFVPKWITNSPIITNPTQQMNYAPSFHQPNPYTHQYAAFDPYQYSFIPSPIAQFQYQMPQFYPNQILMNPSLLNPIQQHGPLLNHNQQRRPNTKKQQKQNNNNNQIKENDKKSEIKQPKGTNIIRLNNDKKEEIFKLNNDEFPTLETKLDSLQISTETQQQPKPIVLDENQKKLMKNINFIKAQVEQHYMYENMNKKNEKLSFKEIVEKQPVIQKQEIEKKSEPIDVSVLKNEQDKIERVEIEGEHDEGDKPKKKTKRKRTRKTKSPSANKAEETVTNDEFEFNNEEFPSLGANDAKADIYQKKINTWVNQSSDEIKIDPKTTSLIDTKTLKEVKIKQKQKNQTPSEKPSTKQLIIEFGDIISALEKGQNVTKNSQVKQEQRNINKSKSVLPINPLDSTGVINKRGKEREKPRNKKPSTLKKVILKEREEKRRMRLVASQQETTINLSPLPLLEYAQTVTTTDYDDKTVKELTSDSYVPSSCNEEQYNNHDDNQSQVEIMTPISQGTPLSYINGYSPYTTASPYTTNSYYPPESITPEKLEQQVKQKIHSRKFREYCNQIINHEIDSVCQALLQDIVRFQDRLYHKSPLKAKSKRRFVMGIREVTKHLKLNKVKCIIMAPNCEKIQSKGGLDEAINKIIQMSIEQNITFVFALGRKGLGRAVNKLVPVSVIGIFDYSGAEQHFKRLVELADTAKEAYSEMVDEYEQEEREKILIESTQRNFIHPLPTIPAHYGHSRTPSNGSNIVIDPNLINYMTHSRTPSGNFVVSNLISSNPPLLAPTHTSHSRNPSGGGVIDFNPLLPFHRKWTHSRNASNGSNISYTSRLSEPMSEIGVPIITQSTSNSVNAIQQYSEQVRNELRDIEASTITNQPEQQLTSNETNANEATDKQYQHHQSSSTNSQQLTCIHEIDAGNEADNEDDNHKNLTEERRRSRMGSKKNSIESNENDNENDEIVDRCRLRVGSKKNSIEENSNKEDEDTTVEID